VTAEPSTARSGTDLLLKLLSGPLPSLMNMPLCCRVRSFENLKPFLHVRLPSLEVKQILLASVAKEENDRVASGPRRTAG
jgi:hypothetical protein